MWHDLGPVERFTLTPLTTARVGKLRVVVTYQAGQFGVLSGVCNHARVQPRRRAARGRPPRRQVRRLSLAQLKVPLSHRTR